MGSLDTCMQLLTRNREIERLVGQGAPASDNQIIIRYRAIRDRTSCAFVKLLANQKNLAVLQNDYFAI